MTVARRPPPVRVSSDSGEASLERSPSLGPDRSPSPPERPLLRERGQIYVTLAAAQRYASDCGLQIEEARRELTEVLVSSGRIRDDAASALAVLQVRARSRARAIDVSAIVAPEGPLLVVAHVQARHLARHNAIDRPPRRIVRPR